MERTEKQLNAHAKKTEANRKRSYKQMLDAKDDIERQLKKATKRNESLNAMIGTIGGIN